MLAKSIEYIQNENKCNIVAYTGRRALDPGGGNFRNFGVGMCRWDPGTLDLYQS